MTTVLVTGFEPFERQQVNASWAAVREVEAAWDEPGTTLVARLLPVSFDRAPLVLAGLLAEVRPDLVLCVGEAGGRSRVGVERIGINVQDARIPDEDGAQPVDRPVRADGPAAYLSSLPVKACLTAVRAAGVPAEVSSTAGTFVCNTIAYVLGDLLADGGSGATDDARGGFVHVPRLPEQVPAGAPSMPAPEAAAGLTAVLRAALATEVDVPVPAGTLS
ncbi:MAG TPA: pyroglutamyl-peptidase I [Cellulomonas sp.]